jgi:hypothetical protein
MDSRAAGPLPRLYQKRSEATKTGGNALTGCHSLGKRNRALMRTGPHSPRPAHTPAVRLTLGRACLLDRTENGEKRLLIWEVPGYGVRPGHCLS